MLGVLIAGCSNGLCCFSCSSGLLTNCHTALVCGRTCVLQVFVPDVHGSCGKQAEGQCPAGLCTVTQLAGRGGSMQRDCSAFTLNHCVL